MRSVIRIRSIAFATLLLSLFVFASQSVQAATLTVSTTADAGIGSLRQAIIDATSNAAANTINFNIPLSDPGYSSATDRFTITLVNQLPDLPLAPLGIDNTTGRGVTVKGNNSFRIFTLVNSAVVNITNLTITQGSSGGGLGGGIYMGDSAVLFLTNCIVSNNTATNGGGGIWVNDSGTLHVINSTISNNTATNGGGGGIYINNSGTLNITGSTVSGNTATVGGGGGIYNGVSGTVNATNITVNGNTAGNLGGGILNNATVTVSSSTISGNSATAGGGGIYNNFTATLNNSLIALNTGADGPDLLGRGSRGKPFTGNSNLIGNADGSEAFGPTTNQLGSTGNPINPRLGPLQDNGGPTFTQALLVCSPAIDAGTTALATDQRGASRPQDGDGVAGAQSDIGAFEVQTPLVCPATGFSVSDVAQAEGNAGTTAFTFTVSLNSPAPAGGVTFDVSTADGTINPANAGSDYVGFLNQPGSIPQGAMSTTINVNVNGDTTLEQNETFFVNVSNVIGATVAKGQGTGTILNEDGSLAAGRMLISEFRFRGPAYNAGSGVGGSRDEYIELYNNTDAPITVSTTDGSAGWAVAALGGDGASVIALVTIPAGTVIPPRAHYLVVNSDQPVDPATGGYSLSSYAAPDGYYVPDIADNAGVALFNTATVTNFTLANRLDAAGFSGFSGAMADLFREGAGLASPGANDGQYAFVRKLTTGLPQDNSNNAADFIFISTDGNVTFPSAVLGAPGPENSSSLIQRNATIKAALIDPQCPGFGSANSACGRVRDGSDTNPANAALGTLTIRRRFTNSTGSSIRQLRFRAVNITTQGSRQSNEADVRALSSSTVTATDSFGNEVTINGLTLEENPPSQLLGGGLNSTLRDATITLGAPLAPGASINVQFRLGVMLNGGFRFLVNVEALTDLADVAGGSLSNLKVGSRRRK